MPKKTKSAAARTGGGNEFLSATRLAAMSAALVCDCIGDHIAAINRAGRALLGGKAKAGDVLTARLEHTTGKPVGSLSVLAKGRQPNRVLLIGAKGRRRPLDVTVKSLGGKGINARMLVVARPAPKAARPARPPSVEIEAPSGFTAQILAATSNGIIALDVDGVITLANPAAADLLNRDTAAMRGMPIERAFVHGAGHADAGKPIPIKAQLENGPFYVDREVHMARTDGETFEALYVVVPLMSERRAVGYVITFRDITRRRRAEAEMRLAGVVFEHSPEGIVVADAQGRVTKVNPAYRRIAGMENSDITGKPLGEILFADGKAPANALDMLQNSERTQWEQWCVAAAGRRYAARISVSVVRDHAGSIQQYVTIIADITRRKLDEEKIIHQANYDQLTGLPNRTLFMDRLTRLVLESRRAKSSIGLMFIDLDGFKAINDTLGHDAGDELLQTTARRLEKCVREADTVARLGGDEFTVIMPLIDNFEAASFVAARIIKSLTEPYKLGGREGKVSASIGISLLPAQAASASELLHNADVAMYEAKRQGKANFQTYRPELEATIKIKEREI